MSDLIQDSVKLLEEGKSLWKPPKGYDKKTGVSSKRVEGEAPKPKKPAKHKDKSPLNVDNYVKGLVASKPKKVNPAFQKNMSSWNVRHGNELVSAHTAFSDPTHPKHATVKKLMTPDGKMKGALNNSFEFSSEDQLIIAECLEELINAYNLTEEEIEILANEAIQSLMEGKDEKPSFFKKKEDEDEEEDEDEDEKDSLKGKQHKIDANKNGKVDAHDFKLLRSKKKKDKELDEALDALLEGGEEKPTLGKIAKDHDEKEDRKREEYLKWRTEKRGERPFVLNAKKRNKKEDIDEALDALLEANRANKAKKNEYHRSLGLGMGKPERQLSRGRKLALGKQRGNLLASREKNIKHMTPGENAELSRMHTAQLRATRKRLKEDRINEVLDSRKAQKSYIRKAITSAGRLVSKGRKEEDKAMSTDGTKYPVKQKRHETNARKAFAKFDKRLKHLDNVEAKAGVKKPTIYPFSA